MATDKKLIKLTITDTVDVRGKTQFLFFTDKNRTQIMKAVNKILKKWRTSDWYFWEEAKKDILEIDPMTFIDIEMDMYE